MEEAPTFFYDTYALLEIIKGNKNYRHYSKNIGIVTTRLNLMELYYRLYVLLGIESADSYHQKYRSFAIEVNDSLIKKAMIFRADTKSKDLSYVDCIGYVFAVENKIKFLTGDNQFKDMDNVEFVK